MVRGPGDGWFSCRVVRVRGPRRRKLRFGILEARPGDLPGVIEEDRTTLPSTDYRELNLDDASPNHTPLDRRQ